LRARLFATEALLLAALGVYGVMAYAVSQRQRELGVCMALGAEPGRIRGMILGQGSKFAVIGLCVGVAMSMMLGQLLSKLLFGVTPSMFHRCSPLLRCSAWRHGPHRGCPRGPRCVSIRSL